MCTREREEVRGSMCKVTGQRAEVWMFDAVAVK